MGTARGAAHVSAAHYWIDSGEFLRRLLSDLKILTLLVVGLLVIFAALPKYRLDIGSADADELLLKLTELGSGGASVLCNPASIERYLSVRIDKENLIKDGGNNSSGAVSSSTQSVFGSYWKLQTKAGTVCGLQLQVTGRRFCDTDSARTQRLVGRRVQIRLPVPGEAGFYDHGYELASDSKQRSVIGWREPSQSCPSNVEIAVAIR